MGTSANHDRVATCSVSEMAHRLGLSRVRFYQLVKKDVFPPPVRSGTQRPFYPPDLQDKCLTIRKTRVGFNGLPVLFNKRRQSGKARSGKGGQYDGLIAALENMGVRVNANTVRRAIHILYPAGLEESQDQSEVLRALFQHFYPDCKDHV